MWRHIFLWNAPFVIALFFFSWQVVFWGLVFLFFAGFYSAPPIRAKARPIFDSIFSASHYIATGVFGFVLMNSSGDIAWPAVCGALMWAIAMHAYSAVPDIEPDTDAGLKTIATFFGVRGTIALCALLYVAAAYIGFTYLGPIMLVLGALYFIMMTLSFLRPQAIMTHYKLFPALNTCAGGILFILVLLSHFSL